MEAARGRARREVSGEPASRDSLRDMELCSLDPCDLGRDQLQNAISWFGGTSPRTQHSSWTPCKTANGESGLIVRQRELGGRGGAISRWGTERAVLGLLPSRSGGDLLSGAGRRAANPGQGLRMP